MGKDRKIIKCLLCNETFKSDYRDAHNRKHHGDLIDARKSIPFCDASQQVVLNPFAAASAAYLPLRIMNYLLLKQFRPILQRESHPRRWKPTSHLQK